MVMATLECKAKQAKSSDCDGSIKSQELESSTNGSASPSEQATELMSTLRTDPGNGQVTAHSLSQQEEKAISPSVLLNASGNLITVLSHKFV